MSTPARGRVVRGIFVTPPFGRSPPVTLEVAETDESRARGLMGRGHLALHHGMLFAFPAPGMHRFWMKNTYIPLDIAWLDSNGVVLDVHTMQPHDETWHQPLVPALYAVEMQAGALSSYGVGLGSRLTLQTR